MKRIAVIPARSGSKRIPGKNIKEFCGKPILAYSIQAALEAGIFDMVMVSTDSEKIAEIARSYGAEVPFLRSEQTSNDFAIDKDVQLEVLSELKKRGMNFDQMAYIYPCAPFVSGKRLVEAVEKLEQTDVAMVFTVTQALAHPYRVYYVDDDGYIKNKFPEYKNYRSQDLPTFYDDCGQFYVFDLNKFYDQDLLENKRAPIILLEEECQDIDTPNDWLLAEYKYNMLKNSK